MKKTLIFVLAAIAAVVTACTGTKTDDKPVVTVTIEPLRYFTERIAGDRMHVVTMIPSGCSPETYEPTAQQMVDLANSEMYIKVGSLGFEHTWMKRLRANAPHLIVIDSSEGIHPTLTANGGNDPHTWTSPANAMRMARNIYRSLTMIDAKDSLYFRARLDSLCDMIAHTDATIANRLMDLQHRSFVIYHPALTYFAADYGLRQLAIEEEGREPSAQMLQGLIDKARKEDVRLIFVQREFANRNTDIVSRGTGARVVEVNPLSYDWEKEMLRITDELCKQQ